VPVMKIGYRLSDASGIDRNDLHFLVQRFNGRQEFRPNVSEMHIVRLHANAKLHSLYGGTGWFTGLWQSEAKRVYVSTADSQILMQTRAGVREAPWKVEKLKGVFTGIWGLDDRFVLAWGIRKGGGIMARFDGRKWKEIQAPGKDKVYAVHGRTPGFLVAVGENGLIARWDGRKWHSMKSSKDDGPFTSVFVADENEIYVGGHKVLLKSAAKGWDSIKAPSQIYGVVKWKDHVWVGAGKSGLMRLGAGKLITVDPAMQAERMDGRGELLISTPDAIVVTSDGKDFKRLKLKAIQNLYKDRPAPG
jgi:hypothetical protein